MRCQRYTCPAEERSLLQNANESWKSTFSAFYFEMRTKYHLLAIFSVYSVTDHEVLKWFATTQMLPRATKRNESRAFIATSLFKLNLSVHTTKQSVTRAASYSGIPAIVILYILFSSCRWLCIELILVIIKVLATWGIDINRRMMRISTRKTNCKIR